MVTIGLNDTKVEIHVSLPELSDGQFPFVFECGHKWVAKALYKILREELWGRVEDIRREEYESGLKDARKKKSERRTWFLRSLNLRGG